MKKQQILCLLILILILFCSCSKDAQLTLSSTENISYKEAEKVDYKKSHDINSVLMFKASVDNKEVGELFIKSFSKDEEKISDNVCKNQYALLNNDNVVYIDADTGLFLKNYNQTPVKLADNVQFNSIYASSGGNVGDFSITPDESSYAYSNNNLRLYVK